MYEAVDISFKAQGKQILNNVSLGIVPGKFTSVVGPNGAGKSSLIKILSNENPNHTGNVLINGQGIRTYTPKELSRIRAVMAQHSTLQFAFSAREVISLSRHAHATSRACNSRVVDEVISVTGLDELANRNYLTLSGGEKQRVQLARVLSQVWEETVFPRYILLDEPTSSLDIAQQQSMFTLVKSVCSRNIGVLAIIHDLNLAAQFSDRICMMSEGAVIDYGNAHAVFTKNNIEKTFCCRVNVYYDPCSNCPFIIPENELLSNNKIAITK
jgi:iron complex transport system ATP-binding protein